MKQSLQPQCARSRAFGPQLRAPCAQQAAEAARLRLSPQGRCDSAQLATRHSTARIGSREAATALLLERVSAGEAAITNEKLRQLRLITAIKTPYLQNGKFDLPAYDAIVELQIENGVDGLIIGGTTGEGQLMSWDEHIMLIAHTVNRYGGNVAVIGNTGSNSTREAVHATEQGFAVGMHAALQINPYYGKTSEAGLAAHFGAVLAEGPAIIYNVPGRTGQDIPDHVVHGLAANPNLLGVKECTGNARIQAYTGQGIACWSGNDDEAHAARHGCGAAGVISVTSNLVPGLFSRLMQSRDDALMDSLQDLVAWLFEEPNPIGVNTALAMCGLIQPVFRLPYVPVSRERRIAGCRLLEKVADHLPGVQDIRPLEDDDFVLLRRY